MPTDNHNDLGNNRLYKISQNVSWFFISTLWFNIHFVPLFFFFFFLEATLANIVWYLIGIIPLGPAISALIGSTLKVIEEDDFSEPGKDFRYFYKINFTDSFKVWLPYLFLTYIFSVNINYYINLASNELGLLAYFFVLLIVIMTLLLIPVFIIQTKFSFRYRDLLRLGLYYFFTKIKITFGNLFIIFIVVFILMAISEWLLFLMPAVLSYIWLLYNYSIVKDVKANFVKEEE